MQRYNLIKLLDEIDEELKSIFLFLAQFSNEELNKKPAPDAWSINEIIQHLMLSEEQSLNYVKKKVQLHQGAIPKANPTSRLRALVLSTSMKQPIKLTAPEAATRDIVAFSNFNDLKERWLAFRAHLRAYLTSIDAAFLSADMYKHPVVGKMDVWGMLNFFLTHLNRHEKQMKKTIRQVEELPTSAVEEVPEMQTMDIKESHLQRVTVGV
jgi:uncharacterized damage-inducible protein DinB